MKLFQIYFFILLTINWCSGIYANASKKDVIRDNQQTTDFLRDDDWDDDIDDYWGDDFNFPEDNKEVDSSYVSCSHGKNECYRPQGEAKGECVLCSLPPWEQDFWNEPEDINQILDGGNKIDNYVDSCLGNQANLVLDPFLWVNEEDTKSRFNELDSLAKEACRQRIKLLKKMISRLENIFQ